MSEHYLKNREDELTPRQRRIAAGAASVVAAAALFLIHDNLIDVADQRQGPEAPTTTTTTVEAPVGDVPTSTGEH